MSLEALLGHLEPSDTDLRTLQTAADESLQKAITQIGIVNLATKVNEVMPAHYSASAQARRLSQESVMQETVCFSKI